MNAFIDPTVHTRAPQDIATRYHLRTPQGLDVLLRWGRIGTAVVVPPDFECRLLERDRPPLQVLLSGLMFSYAGMPKPAQWLAEIFPMMHLS